jgi:hypothetical protein
MVSLASKTLLYLSDTVEKKKFFNFECYDLANDKERVSNFGHFTLFSIGADLRQFWPKTHLNL